MIEIVKTRAENVDGLVVIDATGGVWWTFARPWWDVLAWLRWMLMSGENTWVLLRRDDGNIRVRAVKLAGRYIQIGMPPAKKKR